MVDVVVVVVVVATAAAAGDDDNGHNVDDDGYDDNDMLSTKYLDGVLDDRMCGTVDPVRGAKEDGAPNDCRDLPDLDRQTLGVAEVDQACTVCKANRPVHNDGVLCELQNLQDLQDLWDLPDQHELLKMLRRLQGL